MANTKVTTNVIADDAVTTAKIADNAITAAKIASGAVVADIANDSIDSQHYVAASIDNEHLADNAVDSAELAAGSVDIAHLSASGSASSSTFLAGNNAWAAAGGGAMTLITSTNVTSTTGTVDFESLSGYDTYFLQVSNAVPIADGPYAVMQVGDSSGMDTANQDYGWHLLQIRANSTTVENNAFAHTTDTSETADIKLYRRGVGSSTNEGFSCSIWIHNKPNQFTRIYGMSCATSYLNETQGCFVAAERRAAITMDRVRFKFSTNSIASGRISLYGVSHA